MNYREFIKKNSINEENLDEVLGIGAISKHIKKKKREEWYKRDAELKKEQRKQRLGQTTTPPNKFVKDDRAPKNDVYTVNKKGEIVKT